jgi:hypothetical protein
MKNSFPIQSERGAKPHPVLIPWSLAELAYSVYSARYGRSQSLERLAERGGFGPGEMDMFVPDWRERCSEIARLRVELERVQAVVDGVIHDLNEKVELCCGDRSGFCESYGCGTLQKIVEALEAAKQPA